MMRIRVLSVLGLSSLALVVGCSASKSATMAGSHESIVPSTFDSGSTSSGSPGSAGTAGPASEMMGAPTVAVGSVVASQGGAGPQAGTLTAGDWDDNENFALFQSYLSDHGTQQSSDSFPSADRVVIEVTSSDGHPISNALVQISDASKTYLTAPTATDGRVLFFPGRDGADALTGLSVRITPPAGQTNVASVTVPAPAAGDPWTFALPGAASVLPTALDLAFVIDTTGSMGDELEYLKSEVTGIVDQVNAVFAGTSIHYGLIVYRDTGDTYVTRSFNFTANISSFMANLAAQSSNGGGDEPESMDVALTLADKLTWRTDNTARLSFLIADAPPHEQGYAGYFQAVDGLRREGVKLYPIAGSNASSECEYMMRTGAEATLGRYLFLTDDSGIGDSHEAPHIPCYEVEKLSQLVFRAIASELTGVRSAPKAGDVIRSVGQPQDGVCTLADGTKAYL